MILRLIIWCTWRSYTCACHRVNGRSHACHLFSAAQPAIWNTSPHWLTQQRLPAWCFRCCGHSRTQRGYSWQQQPSCECHTHMVATIINNMLMRKNWDTSWSKAVWLSCRRRKIAGWSQRKRRPRELVVCEKLYFPWARERALLWACSGMRYSAHLSLLGTTALSSVDSYISKGFQMQQSWSVLMKRKWSLYMQHVLLIRGKTPFWGTCCILNLIINY